MPKPNLTLTDFTDDELDELAEITDQDIIDTLAFLGRALDDPFKNLPVAEVEDAQPPTQS